MTQLLLKNNWFTNPNIWLAKRIFNTALLKIYQLHFMFLGHIKCVHCNLSSSQGECYYNSECCIPIHSFGSMNLSLFNVTSQLFSPSKSLLPAILRKRDPTLSSKDHHKMVLATVYECLTITLSQATVLLAIFPILMTTCNYIVMWQLQNIQILVFHKFLGKNELPDLRNTRSDWYGLATIILLILICRRKLTETFSVKRKHTE